MSQDLKNYLKKHLQLHVDHLDRLVELKAEDVSFSGSGTSYHMIPNGDSLISSIEREERAIKNLRQAISNIM